MAGYCDDVWVRGPDHGKLAHACAQSLERDHSCGAAIEEVVFAAGAWWATNYEYATSIRFCPWCGVKLPDTPGSEGRK